MRNLVLYIFIVVSLLSHVGCDKKTTLQVDDSCLVADTVSYIVYIRQQDPYDDAEAQYLSRLDAEKLIESIYSSVFHHQATAYDFLTGQPLSIDDIKTREVEYPQVYGHDNVSVIQFTESWWYDEVNFVFQKKVLSIHVGFGRRDETGYIETNYPGFIIKLQN